MPSRPDSHITGDRAVAAVRAIWAAHGAAVEEIHRDYGEDLLVQTHLSGRMDGSRIWVQVKGTASLSAGSGPPPSVRVSADLALRWVRTLDLVVVVLWDSLNDRGWFVEPQNALPEGQMTSSAGSVAIPLAPESQFDIAAADRLAWRARIKLADAHLQMARKSAEDSRGIDTDGVEHFSAKASAILESIVIDLGICSRPDSPEFALAPRDDFRDRIKSQVYRPEFRNGDPAESASEVGMKAVLQSVLETFRDNAAGNGAPISLLRAITDVAYAMYLGGLK